MRTFAKHTFITGVTQVASFGLGLLTSLVIARGLGPDGKGIYTLTMSVPALLVTLCHLGIQWATVYYVAQRMYPMPEILGSNVWLAIWLGIGSTGLGVILLFFFRGITGARRSARLPFYCPAGNTSRVVLFVPSIYAAWG